MGCVRNLTSSCEALFADADNIINFEFQVDITGITLRLDFCDSKGVTATNTWSVHYNPVAGETQCVMPKGFFDDLVGRQIRYALFNISDGATHLVVSGTAELRRATCP